MTHRLNKTHITQRQGNKDGACTGTSVTAYVYIHINLKKYLVKCNPIIIWMMVLWNISNWLQCMQGHTVPGSRQMTLCCPKDRLDSKAGSIIAINITFRLFKSPLRQTEAIDTLSSCFLFWQLMIKRDLSKNCKFWVCKKVGYF